MREQDKERSKIYDAPSGLGYLVSFPLEKKVRATQTHYEKEHLQVNVWSNLSKRKNRKCVRFNGEMFIEKPVKNMFKSVRV